MTKKTLPVSAVHSDYRGGTLGTLPTRGTPKSAGLDLYAAAACLLQPGQYALIPAGIRIAIPEDHVGIIKPRSGIAVKHGIDVLAGVIDADYRGEVAVALVNHGNEPFSITRGHRIAQLLILPFVSVTPVMVERLDDTERGSAGFGSTGT